MVGSRPASSIRRLVVGGGRAPDFPQLGQFDIALNIDAEALPHVQGDINKAPFRSAVFSAVYFEKVPYDVFSGPNIGAIYEVARLLKSAGRVLIETGVKAPVPEITAAMRRAGFKYVRVTEKGYLRITGRLGGR
jgi:hypothetical protein